ncbi:riboflavin kinase [Malonomonas rubra]|uniref:bifunctional riboflavin kinase/FMN adenylyltransferase n=1 Tax=Malonomonas rubra TaxID=57040 RepID=UPI0026EEC1A9|nr:riboflavin kinase [Malonomonas rubra]
MEIYTSLYQLPDGLRSSVITLGNFDGVHLGHQGLFRELIKKSRQHNCTSTVFTFSPHPLKLLAPEKAPLLLSTLEEKRLLISASQVERLIEAPFTREFAQMSPVQFVDDLLVKRLKIKCLIVGYNYAFGCERRGNIEFLKQRGREKGFEVMVIPPIGGDGPAFSSTRIRQMVAAGQIAEVAQLLGRHFSLEGQVVQKEPRSRGLGLATVTLQTSKEQLPRAGLYAVNVRCGQQGVKGVARIAAQAETGTGKTSVEVYMRDFVSRRGETSLSVDFLETLPGEFRIPELKMPFNDLACDVPHFHQWQGLNKPKTGQQPYSLI